MRCFKCNALVDDDAKFCKNCGASIANAQSGARSNNYRQNLGKIILTEKNLANIHNLFFQRIQAYGELLNRNTYAGVLINEFDARNIKSDVVDSMYDISKYILQFIDKKQIMQINFVNKIIAKFLREDASYFYQLSEKLDILKQKDDKSSPSEDSGCVLFIGGAIIGGIVGSVLLPIIGTFLGVIIGSIIGLIVRMSAKKKKRDILNSRTDEFQKILGAYDDLWGVFVDILLNDIVQNTDIVFQIDNQRYEKLLKK